jgi:hypothetical protein
VRNLIVHAEHGGAESTLGVGNHRNQLGTGDKQRAKAVAVARLAGGTADGALGGVRDGIDRTHIGRSRSRRCGTARSSTRCLRLRGRAKFGRKTSLAGNTRHEQRGRSKGRGSRISNSRCSPGPRGALETWVLSLGQYQAQKQREIIPRCLVILSSDGNLLEQLGTEAP